jgi:3-deoxy-D-manno-octulosonic-acid transferase
MRFYSWLITLLSPLIALLLWRDGKKRIANAHQRHTYWQARMGLKIQPLRFEQAPIWIHCASVGEFKAAEPLMQRLPKSLPLLITTNTPTAAEMLSELCKQRPQTQWRYLPFDWPWAVKRFLNAVHPMPRALWVMETEIWPNLYHQVAEKNIPIALLNARLSQKTLKAPRWLKSIYRQALADAEYILARDEEEAKRFMELGANPKKVHTLCNLKFSQHNLAKNSAKNVQNSQSCFMENLLSEPFVLLASTHEPEELELAQRWLKLNRPERLIIVPRHPQRSEKVISSLQALIDAPKQLSVFSRNDPITEQTRLILIDAMGQLPTLYQNAILVIMGGSFVPKGGHNLLEPALAHCPIITGPDMSDFNSETALLVEVEGAIQVKTYDQAIEQTLKLLTHPSMTKTLVNNAAKALESQQNCSDQYLQILRSHWLTLGHLCAD